MSQQDKYRREGALPYDASDARKKHSKLREYIYIHAGYRRDDPLNILLFGHTQVGKGSAINGICQALVPADVPELISKPASVGPHAANNGQNTPFLQSIPVGEGVPIAMWDCMGFDALDESKERHALGVLTGFQRPNEPINLAAPPNVVANGEQFHPHVILFVIPYAAQGGVPWLHDQDRKRTKMLNMARFVKDIAREQGSQVILVITRYDLSDGKGFLESLAIDMVCRFAGALGVGAEDCLYLNNNPLREARDWDAECLSLQLLQRCVDKTVGVYKCKGLISYVLVIAWAWYGTGEATNGKVVTDAIRRLVGTLFEPVGKGSNLEQRIPGAHFLVNNAAMADPTIAWARGIWIHYRVEKRVLGRLLDSHSRIERREPQLLGGHRFTAENFQNPFLA